MASMNVSVPEAMRAWVQGRIESGHYSSVSDYVRDLIRRDQETNARQMNVKDIRRTIEDSRKQGKTISADAVFDGLENTIRNMAG